MHDRKPPCVFPSLTETELAVIEGSAPGSAMRVRIEPNGEGYVRLEQLAWSPDMGWYCQKSFIIPAPLVRDLITTLRKADCLLPQNHAASAHLDPLAPIPFHAAAPLPHDDEQSTQRRDA